jgi:ApbE superfamily uncharacterized protein (UPF0280 family)
MATVAGAIAQVALEAMVAKGCTHGWVDNGGDVALILDNSATMEAFHEPGTGTAFALRLEPTDGILGVCTSSGRLGHSISLGDSDVALAMADSAILADALATAIGNRVHGTSSLKTCFDHFKGVPGMIGGLAMVDGEVAMQGRLPPLVEVEHNQERLTVHSRMPSGCYSGPSVKAQEVRT